MSHADRTKWDAKYAATPVQDELQPDDWLVSHIAISPPGRALELACGLGHNAIWLAEQGWDVDAVDVSPVGIDVAREFAAKRQATAVNWMVADVDEFEPERDCYDLIVVFRFLDRERLPAMIPAALRPGGRAIYETFLRTELDRAGTHIRNPAFTLEPGELPRLYSSLEVIDYREIELPDRAVAQLVAHNSESGCNERQSPLRYWLTAS